MSLDNVKTISDAENSAETRKNQAAEKCRQSVAEAEAAAKLAIDKARAEADGEAAKVRAAEEEKLEAELRDIVDNTENKKAAVRARAERRLEEAAELIAGRIVSDG